MKRKILSCMLIVCLIMTMMPSMAWAAVDGTETTEVSEPLDISSGELDIRNGSIVITEEGYSQGDVTQAWGENTDHALTITGEAVFGTDKTVTTNYVRVKGGDPEITIRDLTIKQNPNGGGLADEARPAILLDTEQNASLVLEGTNTLQGGSQGPAVQINKDADLTIKDGPGEGTGILYATGGGTGGTTSGIGSAHSNFAGYCFAPDSDETTAAAYGRGGNTLTIESGEIHAATAKYNSNGSIGASYSQLNGFELVHIKGGTVYLDASDISADGKAARNNARGIVANNITIDGGKVVRTLTGVNDGLYAVTNFIMNGGTYVPGTGDGGKIIAKTWYINGGNYGDAEIGAAAEGRIYTTLYFAGHGETQVTVTEGSGETAKTWTAETDAQGYIYTALAPATTALSVQIGDAEAVNMPIANGWGMLEGTCTCDGTEGTVTVTAGSASLHAVDGKPAVTRLTGGYEAAECTAPYHNTFNSKYTYAVAKAEYADSSDASALVSLSGNVLTAQADTEGKAYTVYVTASAGGKTSAELAIPVTTYVNQTEDEEGSHVINVANGDITVEGAAEGKTRYTQGEKSFTVTEGTQVKFVGESAPLVGEVGTMITIKGGSPNMLLSNVTLDNGLYTRGGNNLRPVINLWGAADDNEAGYVDAKIVLEGENTLVAGSNAAAIQINRNATLTLDGTGTLNGEADNQASVIGSAARNRNYAYDVATGETSDDMGAKGNLVINGGTYNLKVGTTERGLGSGNTRAFGDITINGGDITIKRGASTYGSIFNPNNALSGKITITGGTIRADRIRAEYWDTADLTANMDENVTITGGDIYLYNKQEPLHSGNSMSVKNAKIICPEEHDEAKIYVRFNLDIEDADITAGQIAGANQATLLEDEAVTVKNSALYLTTDNWVLNGNYAPMTITGSTIQCPEDNIKSAITTKKSLTITDCGNISTGRIEGCTDWNQCGEDDKTVITNSKLTLYNKGNVLQGASRAMELDKADITCTAPESVITNSTVPDQSGQDLIIKNSAIAGLGKFVINQLDAKLRIENSDVQMTTVRTEADGIVQNNGIMTKSPVEIVNSVIRGESRGDFIQSNAGCGPEVTVTIEGEDTVIDAYNNYRLINVAGDIAIKDGKISHETTANGFYMLHSEQGNINLEGGQIDLTGTSGRINNGIFYAGGGSIVQKGGDVLIKTPASFSSYTATKTGKELNISVLGGNTYGNYRDTNGRKETELYITDGAAGAVKSTAVTITAEDRTWTARTDEEGYITTCLDEATDKILVTIGDNEPKEMTIAGGKGLFQPAVGEGETRIEEGLYVSKEEPDIHGFWEGIERGYEITSVAGGTGSVLSDFNGNRSVTYQLKVEEAGWYNLTLNYATEAGIGRVLAGIRVNDETEILQSLPETEGWESYADGAAGAVYLNAGENLLTIRAAGSDLLPYGGFNLDYFTLEAAEEAPDYAEYTVNHVLYEADAKTEKETVTETYKGIAGEETALMAGVRAEGWWPLTFSQQTIKEDGSAVVTIPYVEGESRKAAEGTVAAGVNTLTLDNVADQTNFKYGQGTVDGETYALRSSATNTSTQYTFNVPLSGKYVVAYKYSHRNGGAVLNFDVNGTVKEVAHENSSAWYVYDRGQSFVADLQKGMNTITVTSGATSINLPYLRLIPLSIEEEGTAVPYDVEHYAKAADGDVSLLDETTLYGIAGELTQAGERSYKGRHAEVYAQTELKAEPAEGENLVKINYVKGDVTVTVDAAKDGGTFKDGTTEQKTISGKMEDEIAASDVPEVTAPEGETFFGWSEDMTVVPKQDVTSYAIYGTEEQIIPLSDSRGIKALLDAPDAVFRDKGPHTYGQADLINGTTNRVTLGGSVYYAFKAPVDGKYRFKALAANDNAYANNQHLTVAVDNVAKDAGWKSMVDGGVIFELTAGVHVFKLTTDYEALAFTGIEVTSLDAARGYDGIYVGADAEAGLGGMVRPYHKGENNYTIYLPGSADPANLSMEWIETEGVAVTDGEGNPVTSGNAPVPAVGETLTYTVTKDGSEPEVYVLTTVTGGEQTKTMFVEIQDGCSDEFTDFAGVNASPNHDAEAGGLLAVTDEGTTENYFVSIKGRGNATWRGHEKKPYNITLYKDNTYDKKLSTELVDGVKAKKWSLLANDADNSLMRNKVSYDIANEMGIGLGSEFVDLWVDGEYLGNYLMTPKNDYQEPEEGYLLELDNYLDFEDPQFTLKGLNEYGGMGGGYINRFTIKGNESGASQMEIKNYMQNAWDALLDVDSEAYQNYIDVESWAKFYLLHEFVKDYDVVSGSNLMYREGLSAEDKLKAGPVWDLDNSMGRVTTNPRLGIEQHSANGWYVSSIRNATVPDFWLQQMGEHESFMEAVYATYLEYKDLFDHVGVSIDEISAGLADSAAMNFDRRDIMTNAQNVRINSTVYHDHGDYSCVITNTWEDYVANLKGYAVARADFLAENILSGSVTIEKAVVDGETVFTAVNNTSSETLVHQWYVDGTAVEGVSGNTYTAKAGEEGKTVSVEVVSGESAIKGALSAELPVYTVTMPEGVGYTAVTEDSDGIVHAGDDFAFTVALDEAYSQSQITVKANGKELTAADGVYIIEDVQQAQTITVEGVLMNQYTLTFDANGGSLAEGETGSRAGYHGTAIDMPADPTRTGYTFAGWVTEADEPFTAETLLKTETVYADWTAIEYAIAYEGLEDADNTKNPVKYTIESDDITLAAPERAGYTFTGWSYEGQSEPVKEVVIAKSSTGDKTYTANWTVIEYAIAYEGLEGADNAKNPVKYTIESDAIILAEPGVRTGYVFAGWTYEGQTTPVKTVVIPKGSYGNKAYTANWTPVVYTITYGGVAGAVNSNPATYTIETAITLTAPAKAGYVFTGWTYAGQTTPVKTVVIPKGSMGNKAYTANFMMIPTAPAKVTTALYGYDDIKVTWSAATGATSYQVYMKKGSGAYKLATTTSSLTYKAKNLADGAKYTFKVVAYNGTLAGGEKASSAIYTLKKVTGVKVVKSGSKVKVSWKNIQGETGYQISKMTKKKGTQKKPTTYKTTKGKYKKLAATKGKTYYYKVRAYKQVGKTKIYGPWSAVKKFKRK